jgi:hypothetical protein
MTQVITKIKTFEAVTKAPLVDLRETYLKRCLNMVFVNVSEVRIEGNFKYCYAAPVLEDGQNEFVGTDSGTVPFYEELTKIPEHISEEQARRYCPKFCNWYQGTTEASGVRLAEKEGSITFIKFNGAVSFNMASYCEFEPVSGQWTDRNFNFNKFKRRFPPVCPKTYKTHTGKDYIENAGDLICGLLELDTNGKPVFKSTKGGKKIYKFKHWFNCSRQFFNMLKYFVENPIDEDGEMERKAFRGSTLMTNSWRKWLKGQVAAGVELTPEYLKNRELNANVNEARFRWLTTEEASIYSVHVYVAMVWIFVYGRFPAGEFVPNNIAGRTSVHEPQAPVQEWDLDPTLVQYLSESWGVEKGPPLEVDNPYDKIQITEVPGKELPFPEKARRRRVAAATQPR